MVHVISNTHHEAFIYCMNLISISYSSVLNLYKVKLLLKVFQRICTYSINLVSAGRPSVCTLSLHVLCQCHAHDCETLFRCWWLKPSDAEFSRQTHIPHLFGIIVHWEKECFHASVRPDCVEITNEDFPDLLYVDLCYSLSQKTTNKKITFVLIFDCVISWWYFVPKYICSAFKESLEMRMQCYANDCKSWDN